MDNGQSRRDKYMLHLFRVFRVKYDKLIQLCESDNIDDSLEISALLRHFIMDGNRLADDVAVEIGLQCSFPVTDEYASKGLLIFKEGFTPNNNARIFHNRDSFLKLSCLSLEDKEISVKELIELVANCGGGVHHDGSKSDLKKYTLLLLETDIANDCLACLQVISSIVIEGLSQVRKAIDREFSFLEQRKRKKQPEILMSKDKDIRLHFSGNSSLEAYCFLDLSKPGCVLFSFIPDELQDTYPAVVLEAGSRKYGQKISLQILDTSTLSFRVYSSTDSFQECLFKYVPLINNIFFFNYKKVAENFNFHCSLVNRVEEQKELTALISWDTVEGKITIGENLKSIDGAKFQSNGTLIFFDRYYTAHDFKQMLNKKPICDERFDKWLEDNIISDRSYVTRIYNQA